MSVFTCWAPICVYLFNINKQSTSTESHAIWGVSVNTYLLVKIWINKLIFKPEENPTYNLHTE